MKLEDFTPYISEMAEYIHIVIANPEGGVTLACFDKLENIPEKEWLGYDVVQITPVAYQLSDRLLRGIEVKIKKGEYDT